MKQSNLPVRKTMCDTCPFRPGSKYAKLAPDLAKSALTDCSRVCHSTGSNNGINRRTGKPPHLCRGARNVQLGFMAGLGVIASAADESWNEKRVKIGLPVQEVKDP
ncbi:MAG: hypothetical protein KGL39_02640 [Patescibacteria group bacterium]|nr:hypothetical protein [Patescibacteria group bacterium]